MRKKLKRISMATKYILVVCFLLLAVNALLGVLLIRQSGDSMRSLLARHMISVAETAAAVIDGDELAALTAADADARAGIVDTLVTIQNAQNDADIKYIYLVKREGNGYVYTVDPDPVDPAGYGDEVVATPGQDIAWFGDAAIDPEPIEDEWGCYYTSWCSVKNAAGEVTGMVGVDFAADWYDQHMHLHTVTVVLVIGFSLLISLVIMFLMTWQLYRRFRTIDRELSNLSGNVENLVRMVDLDPLEGGEAPAERPQPGSDSDVIRQLSDRIHSAQKRLEIYMQYMQKQAFTDAMTHVGNKDAYLDRIKTINREIDTGSAAFSIAVFDVNGLKNTNDNYGHECGDRIIVDTAMLICRVFGRERIYRIGGDEFIAVLDTAGAEELDSGFDRLRSETERFNREEKRYAMVLSLSCGGAVYLPGQDASYKEVFKRADQAMYRDKEAYYGRFGVRPHHYAGEGGSV